MKYLKLFEDLKSEEEDMLKIAVQNDYTDYINKMIKNGVNVNVAFLEACYRNKMNYIELFIKHIKNINYIDGRGRNCIYMILQNSDYNIFTNLDKLKTTMNYLISKGAKSNSMIHDVLYNFNYNKSDDDKIMAVLDYVIECGANIKEESSNICEMMDQTKIDKKIFFYLIKKGLNLDVFVKTFGNGWEFLDWVKAKPLTNIRSYIKTLEFLDLYLNNYPVQIDFLKKYCKIPKEVENNIRQKYKHLFTANDAGLL